MDNQLKAILNQSIVNTEVSIDKSNMVNVFEKIENKERLVRAFEFSDLFFGVIILLLGGLISYQNPALITELHLFAKVGLLVFFLTYLVFHISAFKIKLKKTPSNANLKELLKFELAKVNSRIALFNNYKWLLVGALGGLYTFFFFGMKPAQTESLVILFAGIGFGLMIYKHAQDQIKNDFSPLRKELKDQLNALS